MTRAAVTAKQIETQVVAEGWKLAFQLPHVAGFDAPDAPWWPLRDDELPLLVEPTVRLLARMPIARQAALALWLDPLFLALGVASLIGKRVELSRQYAVQMRINLETEGRRAAISRGLAPADTPGVRRSEPPTPPEPNPDGSESSPSGTHRVVQNIYSAGG